MTNNITLQKLCEFLRPEIADAMYKQWKEDGNPNVEAIELLYDIDPHTNEEIPFICLVYTEEEDTNERQMELDEDMVIPNNEWYETLVERLEHGDI